VTRFYLFINQYLKGVISPEKDIRYIEDYRRFILTNQPPHTAVFFKFVQDLLHPDDRYLLNTNEKKVEVQTFNLSKGTILCNTSFLDGHISMVIDGAIGVCHRLDALLNWSHFYVEKSWLFNLEIHEELNKMDTTWHVLEDTQIYSIDTNVFGQNELKDLMIALSLQRSLLCSYQYQHYINNHGLDRHEYSVNWIKSNRKVAAALPRKELANFLGISNSSLKTYLKEAMEDA